MKDYYSVLGIKKDSGCDEIKNSYRKLAKKYHPDVSCFDSEKSDEKFNEVKEAYDTLSNTHKKREYDRALDKTYDLTWHI